MSELVERKEHLREPKGIAILWFVTLAGPIAWVLGLNADYALVRIACTEGTMLPLHLVSVLTLALVVVGGGVGWREWQRLGRELPGEGGGVISRSRFMVVLGLLASAFFALVIVAQWISKLFLNPCMGI